MAEVKKLNSVDATTEKMEPTYEELKNWCNQLMMQRNQVAQKLNQVTDILNKLPWLFEVIKAKDIFNAKFVAACVNEIETLLTPPETEETGDTEKN